MEVTITRTRNPRAEAQDRLGGGLVARVLEPSPPAVESGPYFADDPVELDGAQPETVVSPAGLGRGGIDWNDWVADHPEHLAWVSENWLGGTRVLPPVPAALEATRTGLHRLATYVIAPARHAVNGKFGLRWTRGGFGTPFFGPDRQIRVEGAALVDQVGEVARAAPVTTLAAASDFLGSPIDNSTAAEHDSPAAGDAEADLGIDEAAAEFLGAWFGMAFAALEALRADERSVDPSRPQLWPGHFDPAIEAGDDSTRASYGASPGDASIDEPYLYVSVWWPDRVSIDTDDADVWNADSFTGRILRLSDFGTGDPAEIATRFWTDTRDLLARSKEG